ncbi:MAG: universal stress protein [Variovorax sp.]|nr:MAG: universal stress protein [Variovorax sp.]
MKIIVAVDGSAYTQKALDYLKTHRASLIDGQPLVLVHVSPAIPPHAASHLDAEALRLYYADEAEKAMGPVRSIFEQADIPFTVDARHGKAATGILEAARAAGADLIVMGTRGQGALGRAIMGSVATEVLTDGGMPVLLVQ